MYVDDLTFKRDGKTYRRVLLRHSKRIKGGGKTNLTIANISNCKGKKIIVYGLLTDDQGDPIGVEVFP